MRDVEILPFVVFLFSYKDFIHGKGPIQAVFGCLQRFLVEPNSVVISLGIFILKASKLHPDFFVARRGVEADDILLEVLLGLIFDKLVEVVVGEGGT